MHQGKLCGEPGSVPVPRPWVSWLYFVSPRLADVPRCPAQTAQARACPLSWARLCPALSAGDSQSQRSRLRSWSPIDHNWAPRHLHPSCLSSLICQAGIRVPLLQVHCSTFWGFSQPLAPHALVRAAPPTPQQQWSATVEPHVMPRPHRGMLWFADRSVSSEESRMLRGQLAYCLMPRRRSS